MKFFVIIAFFIICTFKAQKILPFDTLNLKEVRDMHADDYGNVYLYKNKDFSFTKYDSVGRQLGKLMFTVPFKVQGVQNPLSIPLFSENAQEMRFVDQNLNEIQKIDLRQKFSFIRFAYAEDLQQVWLLDESTKRLLQYNFRNDILNNAYPFDIDLEELTDILVYENKVYVISKSSFRVFSLKFEKLFEIALENGKRLRRENERILIIGQDYISGYTLEDGFYRIFNDPETQIVDKNSSAFYEIKDSKLYLYTKENLTENNFPKKFETGLKTTEDPEDLRKDVLEADKILEKNILKEENIPPPSEQ